jgi:hypothetical protein
MTELLGEDAAFVIRHAERTYAELEEHAERQQVPQLG